MTLRSLIERLLPWYKPGVEKLRDQRTERISQRSEQARERAARVIAAYRHADDRSRQAGVKAREAGEDLIEEVEDR